MISRKWGKAGIIRPPDGHLGQQWGPGCLLLTVTMFHHWCLGQCCPQWPLCQAYFLVWQRICHSSSVVENLDNIDSNEWEHPGPPVPARTREEERDLQQVGNPCPNSVIRHNVSPLHFHPITQKKNRRLKILIWSYAINKNHWTLPNK